ncbi:MAG: hypothetical protein ACFFDN_00305 [Candidatus Hodarchaeota archaeon]
MSKCLNCDYYKELLKHIEERFRESKKYIETFLNDNNNHELREYYKGMLSMENELLYDYFTEPEKLPKFWKRPIKVIELRKKLGLEKKETIKK